MSELSGIMFINLVGHNCLGEEVLFKAFPEMNSIGRSCRKSTGM